METLEEQIARKCIHFNGILNKTCEAGINYDDVKIDRPFKFPCLKQGGECSCAQFRTPEDVKEKVSSIETDGVKVLIAIVTVKDHFEKTKERSGKVTCECGGDLHYAIAIINNHVWAKCSSCGMSFNE